MGRNGYIELARHDTAHSLDLNRGARRVNRRRMFVWVGTILTLILLITVFHMPAQESARTITQMIPNFPVLGSDPPVRIVFVESKGEHDEVLAAWKETWGGMASAEMHTFQWITDQDGSQAMRESLPVSATVDHLSMHTNQTHEWSKLNAPPDIMVITTCEYFPFWLIEHLLNTSTTHLYCTAHDPNQWTQPNFHLEALITPWLLADRITFITLSEHVSRSVLEHLKQWNIIEHGLLEPRMQVLPPIFTVPLHLQDPTDRDVAFAIQDYPTADPRNYGAMFSALTHAKQHIAETCAGDETDTPSVRLHLIGHTDAQLEVPAELKENVFFNQDLLYLDYYSLLSQMTALIPGLSTNDYLTTTASSFIPAALTAGIPLVASDHLLESYSYLDPDAVWRQEEGDSDWDVMVDIVRQTIETRRERVDAARAAAREIIRDNQGRVKRWAMEILEGRDAVREEMEGRGAWEGWEVGVAWWKEGFAHSFNW